MSNNQYIYQSSNYTYNINDFTNINNTQNQQNNNIYSQSMNQKHLKRRESQENETAFESKYKKELSDKKLNQHFISGKNMPKIRESLQGSGILIKNNGDTLTLRQIQKISEENYQQLKNSIVDQETLNKLFQDINGINCNYKSVQIMPNSTTTNTNINLLNLAPLPIKSIKGPDDFGISDEDRIFNQFKKKKKKPKSPIKKAKSKIKIKLKKKKLNPFSSYDSALVKVYKKIPKIINKIENTKKLKGTMSLLKYQNLLLDVGAKNLNRQTREKLNNKFITIRNFTNKPYSLFKESLESIETEEEKIIDSINTQQKYYLRKMKENNYNSITSIGNLGSISLPNLKFFKLGKSKKKPRYRYKYK